jgi:phospholipid transport system substrate-binding protein
MYVRSQFCRSVASSFWKVFVSSILAISFTAVAQDDPTASKVIEDFQSELLGVMKQADGLGYEGRYQRLAPIVKLSHNLPILARVSVGRNWKKLDAQQKQTLIDTFGRLSVATYAHQFDGYTGEAFEIVSEEDTSRGDKLVRTLLVKQDGEQFQLDYVLRRNANRWMIINIVADGVSDLALKRSEYSAILRREGFDALIDKLNGKIENYSLQK